MIGLGTMGENLALNLMDHGTPVAVWNLEPEWTDRFVAAHPDVTPTKSLADLVRALPRPRRMLMMIKAGTPVDLTMEKLAPLCEPGDIVIDGGNSWFKDTQRREAAWRERTNEMGEAPMNIVFEGPREPSTVEQMIASTERGILVTRLWYIREVDPYEKILTGMTRDGTFLVENGKVVCGVRNFRFNQSLIDMLANVEQMSEPVRTSGEESFDMVVPAMKVREFNFTEVTKF